MDERYPANIAGWLWLVAGFQMSFLLRHLQHALAFAGREQVWTPYSVGEAVGLIALPLFVLWCLVLFFRQRRSFPRFFVIQVWLIAAGSLAGLVLAMAKLRIPQDLAVEVGLACWDVALAVVATIYILTSRRVRLTFVR